MEKIFESIKTNSIEISNIKIIEGPEAFFEIIIYFLSYANSVTITTLYFGSKQKDEEIMELLKKKVSYQ